MKIKLPNKKYLILTGNEIKKLNINLSKKVFKQLNLNGIVAEREFLPSYLKKLNKKIIFSDSVAENPLLLLGKLLIKMKIKKMCLAFFDGDISTKRSKIVFEETQDSINKLTKQKLKIFTITKSIFKVNYNNPWLHD